MGASGRVKTALALVGACAALSIVLPPLAGVLNAVGSLTLLALGGYSAYRAWAWMERVVEASRRPTTVRRNLGREGDREPATESRERGRQRGPRVVERGAPDQPEERQLRLRPLVAPVVRRLSEHRGRTL